MQNRDLHDARPRHTRLAGRDTGTGVLLLVLRGVFAACMIAMTAFAMTAFAMTAFAMTAFAMTAFQEPRFDRAAVIVERHTRSVFGAQRVRLALRDIEAVSVDQGDGKCGRRYSRPVLLLRDPPGGSFALSKTFNPFREALHMTRMIEA